MKLSDFKVITDVENGVSRRCLHFSHKIGHAKNTKKQVLAQSKYDQQGMLVKSWEYYRSKLDPTIIDGDLPLIVKPIRNEGYWFTKTGQKRKACKNLFGEL